MNELLEISNNCFKCLNPPCIKDCPIHNKIPQILALYQEGKFLEAYQLLLANNPLFMLCGSLCDQEIFCAKNCLYRKVHQKRIMIEKIEEDLFKRFGFQYHFPQLNHKRALIIGAGPSGLMAALMLRMNGYQVLVIEKASKIGGVINSHIPAFRYNKKILDDLFLALSPYIDFKLGMIYDFHNLLEDKKVYDFIGVAIGNDQPVKMLEHDQVYQGLSLLEELNKGKIITNQKIAVLGLGNTAIDTARTLKRLNNDVTIIYRRTIENAPAAKDELKKLQDEEIPIIPLLSCFKYENNLAYFYQMELGEKGSDNRQKVIKTDKIVTMPFTLLVEAYSSYTNFHVLKNLFPTIFSVDDNQLLINNYQNIYFLGDCYLKPSSIVKALAQSKDIVIKYIKNQETLTNLKKALNGKKIIFGGSFNPMTIAHKQIYDYMKNQISPNIVLLPNGDDYKIKELINFNDRLNLIKKTINDVMIDETLNHQTFKGTYYYLKEHNHPFFVIGSDSLNSLSSWINYEALVQENRFIVFSRNYDYLDNSNFEKILESDEVLKKYKDHFYLIYLDIFKVSSSAFRKTLDPKMVTKECYEEIIKNNLY